MGGILVDGAALSTRLHQRATREQMKGAGKRQMNERGERQRMEADADGDRLQGRDGSHGSGCTGCSSLSPPDSMFTPYTLTTEVDGVNMASMSRTREAYHHGDLRNALISSAMRLIEQGGEAAFSLREAARHVGVSANAAYRHFDDKSALLTAAGAGGLERLASRMRKAMDRAAEDGNRERPAIARFKAVGRAYVEFALAHPELYRLMFSGSGVACLNADAAESATPTPWELLGRSLDALVADGVLPANRREGAELKAWSLVHGFASLALAGHAAIPTGRQRRAALEAALEFGVLGLCGLAGPQQAAGSR